MLKAIRRVGSLAFVLGFFGVLLVVIPWVVTVVDDPKVGGPLGEYTEMMGKARDLALQRMVQQAAGLGADAVINVRFVTTSVVASAAELLAYGTAVKLAPPST